MRTEDFDYALPQELIAQAPASPRARSRLLHVRRGQPACDHRVFEELPGLLRPGDLLVFNDTRVIPARLLGQKAETGGRAELLLLRPAAEVPTGEALECAPETYAWRCLGQASKALRLGARLRFGDALSAKLEAVEGGGQYVVRFASRAPSLLEALRAAGEIPLPPYIDRRPSGDDADRYQTVFARAPGSAAAPTAGLHFSEPLLASLEAAGVRRAFLTLEVGPGTFLPPREGELRFHRMHVERFQVPDATAVAVADAKREGRRVVAVGTTVVRALESAAGPGGTVRAGPGETRLFIVPGFSFGVVDALVTNFHLPRSTLLMLVAAFHGLGETLAAYAEAVRERYRFFSYGDAMLVDGDAGAAAADPGGGLA